MKAKQKRRARVRRHLRVRKRLSGTAACPRLNVYRSNKHIYAQIIDDVMGHTLAAAASTDPALEKAVAGKDKTEQATEVGKLVAKRAMDAGVKEVVFDRGGFQYHGRVKALAEGARETGLKF